MDTDTVRNAGKAEAGKKRGRPRKVTKKALMAAIKGSGGLKGVIAKELGIPLRVVDGYLAIFPDAEKACRDEWDAREAEYLEMAERSLYKALNKGEAWAVRFVSSRPDIGKRFIQRMESAEQKEPNHTPSDHAPELNEGTPYGSERSIFGVYGTEKISDEWMRDDPSMISKLYEEMRKEIPEEMMREIEEQIQYEKEMMLGQREENPLIKPKD